MKRSILACVLALSTWAQAELALDSIYQPHMVLQQGRHVPLRGTCSGSQPVHVSFGDLQLTARRDGSVWHVVLPPMAAEAKGRTLRIEQGDEVLELPDIVVGEVWLASGQSNMLWRLDQTSDQAALRAQENPHLRFYHSEPQVHTNPAAYTDAQRRKLEAKEMYSGAWSVCSPQTRRRMSAVGWYFGRKLQTVIGVPVGIIHVSLGGSEMLAWMPQQTLREKYSDALGSDWLNSPYLDGLWVKTRALQNLRDHTSDLHPYKPGYLFETGIAPWLDFPIAGIIWYQGESDAELPNQDVGKRMLTDIISSWRQEFHSPELPFIMVQLPRINDSTPLRACWPSFREMQAQVAASLPRVYYATTIDLGSTNADVHPKRKIEVGERLAAIAAHSVYGLQVGDVQGPTLLQAVRQGKYALITYSHAAKLHTQDGKSPRGFELSENGKDFYPATAEITRSSAVRLSCDQVRQPKYVRYAWAVYLEPNLVNDANLPARPFCTPLPSKPRRP